MMVDFSKLAQEADVNAESEFHDIAQLAIKQYYLIPYPIKSASSNDVCRPLHGGVHVSNAALNLEMFIALYEKYAPHLLIGPDGSPLTSQQIKLLKLAAIYHDSANESEIHGIEKNHAENFRRDMTHLGFDKNDVEAIAYGIEFKDGVTKKYKYAPGEVSSNKTLFQKLIHDADCLDIMRMNVRFDSTHLDIYQDLCRDPNFLLDLNAIVKNHQETLNRFSLNPKTGRVGRLHQACEGATNCYLAVKSAHHDMLMDHIISECLKRGKTLFSEDIPPGSLSILDTYTRTTSEAVKQLIEQLVQHEEPRDIPAVLSPIQLYSSTGCLIRGLLDSAVNEELNQLERNETALHAANITSIDDLRNYLAEQDLKDGTAFTPQGFKWRPSIYAQAGISIQRFSDFKFGIIIDPTHPKTLAPYFYKGNAASARAISGHFKYEPQTGSLKNKKNIQQMLQKTQEMENRRQGLLEDPNLHYYGRSVLSSNEVLSTYHREGISGIVLFENFNQETIHNALLLRAKLGRPMRPFYRFSPTKGLVVIHESEIKKYIQTIEALGRSLNELISNPPDAITVSDYTPGVLSLQANAQSKPFTLPSIHREIRINIEGMSQKNIDSIKEAIKRIQQSSPENPYYAKSVIANIEIKESPVHITIKIESFDCETMEELDSFIKLEALGRLQSSLLGEELSSKVAEETLGTEEKALAISSLQGITNIHCVSSGQKLSPENPLKFKFSHPSRETIECFACVESGQPVLEFHLENGETVTQPTDLLPKIAKQYYQQQTDALKLLLDEQSTQQWLTQHHISHLQIELTKSSFGKLFISIGVSFLPDADQQLAVSMLSDLLGIDKSSKFRSKDTLFGSSSKKSSESVQWFTASNLDQIERFKDSIQRACRVSSEGHKEHRDQDTGGLTLSGSGKPPV